MSNGGDEEGYNTVGCGALTLLIGAVIFWAGYSTLGTGTRPIGTIGALIFGSLFALAGIYRIIVGMIRGDWKL